MARIEINRISGGEECEDCGYYEWTPVTLRIDGVEVGRWSGDTHFSGGYHELDGDQFLKKVLEMLGHEVELNCEVDEE